MQGAAHDATYQGLGLRSYEGDFTDMHQFGGPVIKCLVHGSRNMDTLRADAVLLERALAAGMPLGGFRTEHAVVGGVINVQPGRPPLTNDTPGSPFPGSSTACASVLTRLEQAAARHRVRLDEYFKDFDRCSPHPSITPSIHPLATPPPRDDARRHATQRDTTRYDAPPPHRRHITLP